MLKSIEKEEKIVFKQNDVRNNLAAAHVSFGSRWLNSNDKLQIR